MTNAVWRRRWRRATRAGLAAAISVSAGLAVQGETLSVKPQVESAGDPAATVWLILTNFAASASARDIVVEDTALEPGRYYRVRSP